MSEDWTYNYYNYFTEVEEHFQRVRGTGLFLLSSLDWALLETWKNSQVPLEAVLRGIDEAFRKWRSRKSRTQMVNSLAYCAQAVLKEAQAMADSAQAPRRPAAPPFSVEDLKDFLAMNAVDLRRRGDPAIEEIADRLDQMVGQGDSLYQDLEELERQLTALEDKLIALVRARQSEDELLAARRALDAELRPYRGKMTAEQLVMLEKQYLDRRALESAGLPRLSLFYLF